MRAALDGLAVVTVRTDSNASDRADTLFCRDSRLRRREEFTSRDASAGPVVTEFAGSWAIADTAAQPDGGLAAQVLVRADDPSIELRTLTFVLGTDGRVRQQGVGATDTQRSDAGCPPPPAGAPQENDTPEARRRALATLTGRRFDVPGIGVTDVCPGPRLRRTEGGGLVADGPLVVEWALSDGSNLVALLRVEDAGRRRARRVGIALPSSGPADVQELGRGDPAPRSVTPGSASC